MQSSASLTISDLWIERGERDLCKDFSFSAQSGEVVRILGENGAGKSSLLKVIVGVISPLEGTIVYLGEDVTLDRAPLLQDAIYIGHSVGVKSLLTVAENIRRYCPTVSPEALSAVLKKLDLLDHMNAFASTLSAGQLRRVALARLWLTDKTLWLLDEPFAALDSTAIALLEERIRLHVSSGGLVVLTTHQALRSLPCRDVALMS
ncbi:cytochrome c biogenesis heme-transporting ATPase CcmA [Marinomonas sp. FW-1]|uniref:cytochrome c biogenesis heme-transporting ATPase CcmA n=1 Tax=Marinomonas sp. FW-1 TaxID=2071621 RepID=UPI0010C152EB|nr:cytochrome c biogenesis heme-transporting ATPase CcmA [Marinomonas sp. FW-1]